MKRYDLEADDKGKVGYASNHLGGTVTPPGNLTLADPTTPYVLELTEVEGSNLAGGGIVIDLETETLNWSAG